MMYSQMMHYPVVTSTFNFSQVLCLIQCDIHPGTTQKTESSENWT